MDITDRIKKLGKFFYQMQIVPDGDSQVIYVTVHFPPEWQVDEEIAKKHDVIISPGDSYGEFYFGADIDTGEAAIFDTIDEIIEKMKEAIERSELFNKTRERLKKMFEDESIPIERLRKIEIKLGNGENEIIVPKPKEKKNE